MNDMTNGKYDDIIDLPRHISAKHPPMSVYDRAAQFSPFSALSGYEAAIDETARLTDARSELDEYEKLRISDIINQIKENIGNDPQVNVTYFLSDRKKDGGKYLTVLGNVRRTDDERRILQMQGGENIPYEDIVYIEIVKCQGGEE